MLHLYVTLISNLVHQFVIVDWEKYLGYSLRLINLMYFQMYFHTELRVCSQTVLD